MPKFGRRSKERLATCDERLQEVFNEVIEGNLVYIDKADIVAFEEIHPSPFDSNEYLGMYQDTHPEHTEPYTQYIQEVLSTNSRLCF